MAQNLGLQASQNPLGGVWLHSGTDLVDSAKPANQNPWAVTFGQPRADIDFKARPYSNVNKATWVMPEAYKGRSEYIENTMYLLARANNSFVTSALLPMVLDDGPLMSNSNRWVFPTISPTVMAPRGTPRIVRSRQIEMFDVMTMYGLGMVMEHGFMNSELGMQHYRMHMRQINQSVSEGLQFQGIYKILTCEDSAKQYMLVNGTPGRAAQMNRIMKRELSRWAILQTNRNAWSLLNDLIDAENDLINPNVQLTTFLIDTTIKSLVKHSYDQTNFSLRGPKAGRNIDDTLEGFRLTDNGDVVFVTRGYLVGDEGGVVAPTRREVSIGEFHVTKPYTELKTEYSTKNMAITIYDETNDDWASISLNTMLQHCTRFNPSNGKLLGFGDQAAMRYARDNFTPEEHELDFLHYRNARGELVPVEYFGHIAEHHMNKDDYMNAGEIAAKSLAKRLGQEVSYFIRTTQEVLGIINIVRNYEYNDRYVAYLEALRDANPGLENGRVLEFDNGLGRVNITNNNSFGSLNIPSFAETNDLYKAFVVPPTHMFSYGGMQTIAQMSTNTQQSASYNEKMMDTVARFVAMTDEIVPVLQRFYPDSIFLNPEYALPHHENPTAHDVFIESLVLTGTPFTQLYYNPGTGVDADGNILNEAGNISPERLLASEIENEILNGVDRAFAGEIGAIGSPVEAGSARVGSAIGLDGITDEVIDGSKIQYSGLSGDDQATMKDTLAYTSLWTIPKDRFASANIPVEEVVRGLVARQVVLTLYAAVDPVVAKFKKANSVIQEVVGRIDTDRITDISNSFRTVPQIQRMAAEMYAMFNREKVRRKGINTNDNIKATIDSFIDAIPQHVARTRRFLEERDRIRSANEDVRNRLQRYADVAVQARNQLLLTPISVPHAFISSYAKNLDVKKPVTWLLASTADPREIMDIRQFQSLVDVYVRTARASSTIGADIARTGVESIHAPSSFSSDIKEGIEHNNAFRSVVNRQRIASAIDEAENSPQARASVSNAALRREDLIVTGGAAIGTGLHSDLGNFKNPYVRKHQESLLQKRDRDAAFGVDRSAGGGWAENRSALGETSLWNGPNLLEEDEREMKRQSFAAETVARKTGSSMDRFLNRRLTANFATLYRQITRASDLEINRWCALIFLGTPVTLQAFESTLRYDLLHPAQYLITRPHARYTTCTVVKMLPGLATGRTKFGHVMAELGDDPIQRCHTVNLTYWSSARIDEPKNININHNCAVIAYHGGLGSGFYDRASYNPQQNKYGDSRNASCFSHMIPLRERIEANPLNITGRNDWIENGRQYGNVKSDLAYSTAVWANGWYGFQQWRWNSDMTQAGPGPMQTHFAVPNAFCFSSYTRYEDGTNTTNSGHWKNHTVGPDCAGPRIGQGSFLNAPTVGEISRSAPVATVF